MKLITAPNEWLNTQVKPFDFDTMDAEAVSQEMIDAMKSQGGLGLAAN